MYYVRMIFRNALRHRLRSGLTVLGIVVAIVAFGLLRTVVDAWYAGAAAASKTRLITRSSISLAFTLPISYEARIKGVEGVTTVARSTWFGGIYKEPKNFFPQFAVSGNYLDLYGEFLLPDAERQAWMRDRRGALIGRQLANQYGFKVGDVIPLRGSIYQGEWQFVVRGIFDAGYYEFNMAYIATSLAYAQDLYGLEDAVRADAHRTQAGLRPRDDLPLEQHHVGDGDERPVQDDRDLEKRNQKRVDHRSTSPSTLLFSSGATTLPPALVTGNPT